MRAFSAVAIGAALIGGCLALGRWERSSSISTSAHNIEQLRASIGPTLASTALTGVAATGDDTCLTYAVPRYSPGLGLCFDAEGRLLEAISFGPSDARTYSVAAHPDATPVKIDVARLHRLVAWLKVRQALVPLSRKVPLAFNAWTRPARELRSLVRVGGRDRRRAIRASSGCTAVVAVFDSIRRRTPTSALPWLNRIMDRFELAARVEHEAAQQLLHIPWSPASVAAYRRLDARARRLTAAATRSVPVIVRQQTFTIKRFQP